MRCYVQSCEFITTRRSIEASPLSFIRCCHSGTNDVNFRISLLVGMVRWKTLRILCSTKVMQPTWKLRSGRVTSDRKMTSTGMSRAKWGRRPNVRYRCTVAFENVETLATLGYAIQIPTPAEQKILRTRALFCSAEKWTQFSSEIHTYTKCLLGVFLRLLTSIRAVRVGPFTSLSLAANTRQAPAQYFLFILVIRFLSTSSSK